MSKIKFLGEINEPFQMETGLRQGDRLSLMLFNLILDKIMKTFWENIDSCARIQ